MRKTTAIELELFKDSNSGVKFHAKQFDDLKLKIKVFNGAEVVDVSNQEITAFILKEDKTVIEQKKDIKVEDKTIIIDLSKQATTALGKCSMELILKDDEGIASTSTVSYMVSEKLSASIVEMIKSEDDINALNLIEEFIETSNVDILEIKEAIKDIKDNTLNAENKLDEKYEEIVRALDEYVNDALEKATEAVEKAEEAITTINSSIERIDSIEELVDSAIDDINSSKMEVIGNISEVKEQAITEIVEEVTNEKNKVTNTIEELKTDTLEAIRDNGNGVANALNTLSDTLKADITNTGLLETNKVVNAREEAIAKIDDLKDNVLGSLGEEALKVEEELNTTVTEVKEQTETELRVSSRAIVEETVENIETTKDEAIEGVKASKDTVLNEVRAELSTEKDKIVLEASETIKTVKEDAINEINTAKENVLSEANAELNNAKSTILSEVTATLEGIKTNAINDTEEELNVTVARIKEQAEIELNACKSDLDAYVILAKEQCKTDLDGIKDGVIVEVNNLKGEVDTLLNSLNEKIVESNGNIEELSGLIEEAREVAGLVRAFIDSKAVDLSNYYTREETNTLIDEKIGLIEFPETDLSDYYNKKEVDNLTNPYKGAIGEDPHPIEFKSAPPMEDGENYYFRCLSYRGKYRVYYLQNEMVLRKSDSQVDYCELWAIGNRGLRVFAYNDTTREWEAQEKETYLRVYAKNVNDISENIYSSNLDLYDNAGTAILVNSKPGDPATAPLNTYNIGEAGEYKVSHIEAIEGCYKDNFEGLLVVKNVNGDIYQELISSDNNIKVIRSRINNNWTEWKEVGGTSDIDLTSLATKEELQEAINNIDIPEVDLSSYSTTEEVRNLINESIGLVRSSLIEDINDIIGGI